MRKLHSYVSRFIWWIRYRTTDRYHVIQTGLEPGYYDFKGQALHGLFTSFISRWDGTKTMVKVGDEPEDLAAYEELEEAAFFWRVRPDLEKYISDRWLSRLRSSLSCYPKGQKSIEEWVSSFFQPKEETRREREELFTLDILERELDQMDQHYLCLLIKNWNYIDW